METISIKLSDVISKLPDFINIKTGYNGHNKIKVSCSYNPDKLDDIYQGWEITENDIMSYGMQMTLIIRIIKDVIKKISNESIDLTYNPGSGRNDKLPDYERILQNIIDITDGDEESPENRKKQKCIIASAADVCLMEQVLKKTDKFESLAKDNNKFISCAYNYNGIDVYQNAFRKGRETKVNFFYKENIELWINADNNDIEIKVEEIIGEDSQLKLKCTCGINAELKIVDDNDFLNILF